MRPMHPDIMVYQTLLVHVALSHLSMEQSGCPRVAFSCPVAWAPMQNSASWWDNWMKSRANFPCRVCTSQLKRNISSDCASVSLDVAMTESTCAFPSCLLLRTGWCALDGVIIPLEGTGTSVSIPPLSRGRDPLLMSKDIMRSESMVVRYGVTRVDRKRGGEDTLVSLCVYIHGTCLSQHIAPLGQDTHWKCPCQWIHHAWVWGCAQLQLCTHGSSPCSFLFTHAWRRSLGEVVCVWPHDHVPTYPSLHNFQWPQIQDASGSLENFCSLISW